MDDVDVLVIGAGLAGLNTARLLERAGLEVVVVEASETVGGRVRTELVDGFRVDRGFQVLNPAYPALRAAVDLDRLALRRFGRGVAVRTADGLRVLADPLRTPRLAAGPAGAVLADPGGTWALLRWAAPTLAGRRAIEASPEAGFFDSLDAGGVSGPLREQVLEPFLAGVLGDADGATSARFVRWLLRWFMLGTPGLPAQGMAAVPAQLAQGLRAPVRLGVSVNGLERSGGGWIARTGGGAITSRAVVVAAGPVASAALLGRRPPAMRGLATWWFAPEEPPTTSHFLHVDGLGGGPVVNTAVVSNAQPSYAPAGRHLVQASTLLVGRAPAEAEVRAHLGVIYGRPATAWPLVAAQEIRDALPAIAPGGWRTPPSGDSDVAAGADGLVLAGDDTDASIQGALASGQAAAERVRRQLGS